MHRLLILLTTAALLGGLASAQPMQVRVKTVARGIELDAGSGPKLFVCAGGRVTHQLRVGSRVVNTGGKFLTLTFDLENQHLSLEAHDQSRPLEFNQVRLTCVGGQVQVEVGHDVEVTGGE